MTHTHPDAQARRCTEAKPCGQCGRCVAVEYYSRSGSWRNSLEQLADIIDHALSKRAEWMREQAAKAVLEKLRAEGSASAAPTAIRALPLAPGGDDAE
jgi:hypothetical protein